MVQIELVIVVKPQQINKCSSTNTHSLQVGLQNSIILDKLSSNSTFIVLNDDVVGIVYSDHVNS